MFVREFIRTLFGLIRFFLLLFTAYFCDTVMRRRCTINAGHPTAANSSAYRVGMYRTFPIKRPFYYFSVRHLLKSQEVNKLIINGYIYGYIYINVYVHPNDGGGGSTIPALRASSAQEGWK
jgi:hypothetical protein